jgi:hypothetical protein
MVGLAVHRIIYRGHVASGNHHADPRIIKPGKLITRGLTHVFKMMESCREPKTAHGSQDVKEKWKPANFPPDLLWI